jgi:hypothetical protein
MPQIDWLDDGYYKVRLRARGPWVPVRVVLEDGERDPETWELLSDQWLRAEWYPRTDSAQAYSVPVRFLFNRAQPVSRSEFEWLILLRKLAARNPSPPR